MNTSLARPLLLSLDSFAYACGLHPELVVRLVSMGLLEASTDARGRLWFSPAELARAARIQRLRTGLSLNYAALGLVLDLLDRIEALEAALRSPSSTHGKRAPSNEVGGIDRPWT